MNDIEKKIEENKQNNDKHNALFKKKLSIGEYLYLNKQ